MDKSNVSLERMRTFVRVVERGSLSNVARDLGIGQSSVTRHIRELEDAVGVPLISRTTRRLTVTDEGKGYYANCLQVLRLVDMANSEVRSGRKALEGAIRISCTAAFGVRQLCRLVFDFQKEFPGILIDLNLTDDRIDLVREGVDLAIRLGPLTDSSMKLRALGRSRRLIVASPAYLNTHGQPNKPSDLASHQCIRMSNIVGSDTIELTRQDGQSVLTQFSGNFRADHGLAVREAILNGQGIAASHEWMIDDLLTDGRLKAILTQYTVSPVPLNMLIVPERASILRVRRLIDYLSHKISTVPGIEPTS